VTATVTTMNNIKLELSLDDCNLVLEALGQQPYVRVYALIARLQEQARRQVAAREQAQQDPEAHG